METKQTPLYDWHRRHRAHMSVFGGFDMPLWFEARARAEHVSVLTACGLFDTCHMSVVRISGSGAFDLLQWCFCRDLSACVSPGKKPLTPGTCAYGVFLNDVAGVIDDGIVYNLARDEYLLIVNAGMGGRIVRHLTGRKGSRAAAVTDITDRTGKIDIQGPCSALVLRELLLDSVSVFSTLPYFSFKGGIDSIPSDTEPVRFTNGIPAMLSRTGYTGEFGFELFVERSQVVDVWDMLYALGERYSMKPCGLAARDSLRTGAGLPLSHQDIGDWPFINNPWTFVLPYTSTKTGFSKDFIGRIALENIDNSDYTYPYAGFDVRKVAGDDEPPAVLDSSGVEIGNVLTCVTDMGIGRAGDRIYSIASPDKPYGFVPAGLNCGFVKVRTPLHEGDSITLHKGMRSITVSVASDIRPDRTARKPIKKMLDYKSDT